MPLKQHVVHVVDVVCINGEKFVYIDLNKERIMEVLSKFITCIDAGLKAYVRANRTLSDLAIEIIEKDESEGLPADFVAKKLLKIVKSKHRRFRYMPGSLAQRVVFILKRFLPYKLFAHILISHYKVPRSFNKKP